MRVFIHLFLQELGKAYNAPFLGTGAADFSPK
jgi:hypothetical protein